MYYIIYKYTDENGKFKEVKSPSKFSEDEAEYLASLNTFAIKE